MKNTIQILFGDHSKKRPGGEYKQGYSVVSPLGIFPCLKARDQELWIYVRDIYEENKIDR